MALGPAASALSRNVLEIKFLGPTLDLMNAKLGMGVGVGRN